MIYRRLGSSEIEASVIGLGTFEIGGSSWWDGVNDDDSILAVSHAIDLGINFIDTAPVYGFGHSETIVGRAIRGCRSKVILATKVGEEFSGFREGRFHYRHDGRDVHTCLTPISIRRQLENSLRNLGTDFIDIYSPHFYFNDKDVGTIEDCAGTLQELRREGKIRYVTVSNIGLEQLKLFRKELGNTLCGMQVYCNLLDQSAIGSPTLEYLIGNNISAIGINSLAKGLLSGGISNSYTVKVGAERSENPWFLEGRIARVNSMIAAWQPLLDKYAVSSSALSIAWVLEQVGFSHIVVGATNEKHISDMVDGAELKVAKSDATHLGTVASALRAELIEQPVKTAEQVVASLARDATPVIIWGAGITADYLSRRLPLHMCNIVAVADSNPSLAGSIRFGREVQALDIVSKIGEEAVILVLIPSDVNSLNKLLDMIGNRKKVIHLGWLKALCK